VNGTASTGADVAEATKYQQATFEVIDGLLGQVLTIDAVLQKIAKATASEVTATSN
jgi:hypothetical protein